MVYNRCNPRNFLLFRQGYRRGNAPNLCRGRGAEMEAERVLHHQNKGEAFRRKALWLVRFWSMIGAFGLLIPYGHAVYSTIMQNLSAISLALGTFVFSQKITGNMQAAVLMLLPAGVFGFTLLRRLNNKRFGYMVTAVLAICAFLWNDAARSETIKQCAEYGYTFQPGIGYYCILLFGWGVLVTSVFVCLLGCREAYLASTQRNEEDWER